MKNLCVKGLAVEICYENQRKSSQGSEGYEDDEYSHRYKYLCIF